MKLIAHRGNTTGPNPAQENHPNYLLLTLSKGYDCEVDVRYINNEFFLGHDTPDYKIDISFLLEHKDRFWIHCKNFEAFDELIQIKELNIFWHENDHYTLTSHQYIWAHPNAKTSERSIIVMPEWHNFLYDKGYGICTDYVEKIKESLSK
jgi:hypothetical protein